MTSAREQLAVLALFVLAGLAVASPGSRILGMLVVALVLAAVFVSGLVGRYGARSTALGFMAIAAFLVPMNNLRLGANVTFADVFLVASGLLAFVASARPSDAPVSERRPIRTDVLAALLLLAGGVVGSQFATDLGASLASILKFGLAAIGVPLVFVALAPGRPQLRVLAWAYVAGASVNSIVGVITYDPFNRGIGLSTHSNHLALGCVFAGGMAAALFLTSTGRPARWAAACWAMVSVGVLTSGSRAGAIGAAVTVLVIMLVTGSARLIRWGVAVVVAVAALVQIGVVSWDNQNALSRLLGRDPAAVEMSNFGRAQLRAEAIEAIRAHPITGSGFEEARVAHNLYLQIWGAAGLVGLLGMAVLWKGAVRGVLLGAAGDRFLLGLAAAAVAFLVLAVASNILWDRYLWFALAVFVSARTQAATGDTEEPVPSPVPVPA